MAWLDLPWALLVGFGRLGCARLRRGIWRGSTGDLHPRLWALGLAKFMDF